MEAYDSSGPSQPFVAFAPENFRKIIQRQIATTVNTQVNAAFVFSKGNADGRFGGSRPSTTIMSSNQFGLPYFIVGKSLVGRLFVAGP